MTRGKQTRGRVNPDVVKVKIHDRTLQSCWSGCLGSEQGPPRPVTPARAREPPPLWSAARLRRALFNPPSVIFSYVLKHSITNTVWLSGPTSKSHSGEIRASYTGDRIKQNLSFLFQCVSKSLMENGMTFRRPMSKTAPAFAEVVMMLTQACAHCI